MKNKRRIHFYSLLEIHPAYAGDVTSCVFIAMTLTESLIILVLANFVNVITFVAFILGTT
jgi:hypothetical protein